MAAKTAKRVRKFGEPVSVLLDRERVLHMDMTTMYDYEQVSGKSLLNGDQVNLTDMTSMNQLLWASCGGSDCELSIREIGRLVNPGNYAEILAALMSLLAQWTGPSESDGSGEGEEQGNASGSIG